MTMLTWLEKGTFSQYEPRTQGYAAYQIEEPHEVLRAGQIMHSDLVTVESASTIEEALKVMTNHMIHHLPVLEEGYLVGLVSDRDLLESYDEEEVLVDEIMAERLLTAREDSSIWQVAQIMLSHKINCVLVVDDEQCLKGLITSLDILSLMTHQAPIEVWG